MQERSDPRESKVCMPVGDVREDGAVQRSFRLADKHSCGDAPHKYLQRVSAEKGNGWAGPDSHQSREEGAGTIHEDGKGREIKEAANAECAPPRPKPPEIGSYDVP